MRVHFASPSALSNREREKERERERETERETETERALVAPSTEERVRVGDRVTEKSVCSPVRRKDKERERVCVRRGEMDLSFRCRFAHDKYRAVARGRFKRRKRADEK